MTTNDSSLAGSRRRAFPRGRRLVSWVLQVLLALVFLMAGASKLTGDAAQVTLFDDLGSGQWLRFVVGVLEVAGAVGLLVPRLVVAAAGGLFLLMIGATIANVAVLGYSPVFTVVLVLASAAVVLLRRPRRA